MAVTHALYLSGKQVQTAHRGSLQPIQISHQALIKPIGPAPPLVMLFGAERMRFRAYYGVTAARLDQAGGANDAGDPAPHPIRLSPHHHPPQRH